jgi:hypothetical protein
MIKLKTILAAAALAGVSIGAHADPDVTNCTFGREHVKILLTPDPSPPSFSIGLDGKRYPFFTIYGHAKVIDSAGVHRGWYEGSADSTSVYEYGRWATFLQPRWYLRAENTRWFKSTVTFPNGKWRTMHCA